MTITRLLLALTLLTSLCMGQQLGTPVGQTTLNFSPQLTINRKKIQLELWSVRGETQANRPPTAAQIDAIAIAHGLNYLESAVANSELNAKQARSLPARIYKYGTYAVTGLAALKNINPNVITMTTQETQGINIAAGFLNYLIPIAQKDIPPPFDPALAPLVIGGSLLMDSSGTISGLFWTTPSAVKSFTEKL